LSAKHKLVAPAAPPADPAAAGGRLAREVDVLAKGDAERIAIGPQRRVAEMASFPRLDRPAACANQGGRSAHQKGRPRSHCVASHFFASRLPARAVSICATCAWTVFAP